VALETLSRREGLLAVVAGAAGLIPVHLKKSSLVQFSLLPFRILFTHELHTMVLRRDEESILGELVPCLSRLFSNDFEGGQQESWGARLFGGI
jgi:hypothetical protein